MRLIRSTAFCSHRSLIIFPPGQYSLRETAGKETDLLEHVLEGLLIVHQRMQVKVPVVGSETFPVLEELWEERKEEEEEVKSLSGEDEERRDEFLKAGQVGQSFPIFVEGAGKTCVFVIDTDMTLEDLEQLIQDAMCLPKGCFFLTLYGKVLDANRMSSLARDVSVRVSFRLQGGMMRVPRDSPCQWTCDYCGIARCWATRSTCYRCGEARGHTEDLQRHYRNMVREAQKKGRPIRLFRLSHLLLLRLGPRRRLLLVLCLLVFLRTRLLGLLPSLSRKWTRFMIRIRLLFFARLWRCWRIATFLPGVLDEIRKVVPPHRRPARKAPKVSRELIVLKMKKKLEKEEQ